MNEKFKLLAEKSGFLLWEDEPWKPEGAIVDWSSQYDGELERFAEMIVKECAEICLEANDHKNILRHFGVDK